ncbi:MAG: GpE family phage tail protein [Pseudomonadota bacterium]
MIADLAAIFHWQPSEIKCLTLSELKAYHQLARERGGAHL